MLYSGFSLRPFFPCDRWKKEKLPELNSLADSNLTVVLRKRSVTAMSTGDARTQVGNTFCIWIPRLCKTNKM